MLLLVLVLPPDVARARLEEPGRQRLLGGGGGRLALAGVVHLDVLVRAGAGVAEDVGVDGHAAGALHVAPGDKGKIMVVYQGHSCEILDGIRREKDKVSLVSSSWLKERAAAFYSRQGANKFFFWEIGASISRSKSAHGEREGGKAEINGLGEPRRTFASEKGETRTGSPSRTCRVKG